jgi:hypothetical protein
MAFEPDFHKSLYEINAIGDYNNNTVFLAISNINMVDMQTCEVGSKHYDFFSGKTHHLGENPYKHLC